MSKRICIAASGCMRRWHVWLAEALRRRGKHHVSLIRIEGGDPLPLVLAHVIALEKIVYRLPSECALDAVTRSEIEAAQVPNADDADAVYDIVIAMGRATSRLPKARRTLVPFFDAAPSELGALSTIFEDGRGDVRSPAHRSVRTAAWPWRSVRSCDQSAWHRFVFFSE